MSRIPAARMKMKKADKDEVRDVPSLRILLAGTDSTSDHSGGLF